MAEQAKFVIIKHDGKQIGVSEELDLKNCKLRYLDKLMLLFVSVILF